MNKRRHMDSLSAVLTSLKRRNQDTEFFIPAKGQLALNGKIYQQRDVQILRTYRFEGESDPADQAIIYVVKTNDGSMGYSIDGYGMYSSHTSDLHRDFIQRTAILKSRGPALDASSLPASNFHSRAQISNQP